MRHVPALLRQDLLFQLRQGIHPLYAVLTLLYALLLIYVPTSLKSAVFPVLVLSEPSVLGMFFIGGILYFEKEQRTLDALFVSPISVTEYLISKIVTLGLVGLGLSAALSLLLTPISVTRLWLVPAVLLTSSCFTSLGILLAVHIRNLTTYLLAAGMLNIPAVVPLADHFELIESPWFFLIPTQGTLVLVRAAIDVGTSPTELLAAVMSLAVWTALLAVAARGALMQQLIGITGAPPPAPKEQRGIS